MPVRAACAAVGVELRAVGFDKDEEGEAAASGLYRVRLFPCGSVEEGGSDLVAHGFVFAVDVFWKLSISQHGAGLGGFLCLGGSRGIEGVGGSDRVEVEDGDYAGLPESTLREEPLSVSVYVVCRQEASLLSIDRCGIFNKRPV